MKTQIERFIATRLPVIASRGICLKKHGQAISTLIDGLTRWLIKLEDKFGIEALDIIKKAQFELGCEIAEKIKKEYKLCSDINAALDLMRILIIPFGIKMKTKRIGDDRIREEKTECPIYDVFKRHEVDYCEELCISLGNGWLYAINPNLKFELVRKGGKDHYCIKDIVKTLNR